MTTKKETAKQGAFALNNGNLIHIGSFASIEDAETAIQAWREDEVHNRMGVFCYITPIVVSEAP